MRTEKRPSSGLTLIIVSTGIAGVAAYATSIVLPSLIGGLAYSAFAVYWSAMYLVVAALGGIQQEIARGTGSDYAATGHGRARIFAITAATAVAGAVVISAAWWGDTVFLDAGWQLVLPLAFAAGSYVVLSTVCGMLYGVRGWNVIAWLLSGDAVLRLGSVVLTALLTHDVVALAWAATAPFLVTIIVFSRPILRALRGRARLHDDYRRITWNVSRTVVASTSSGLIISGFPLLLSISAPGEDAALLASLYLAITLTRAPLIVTVMSLQSYLIVRFRDDSDAFGRTLVVAFGTIVAATVVLGTLGLLLGPVVFSALFPILPTLPGIFFSALIGSSTLVAALSVTGAATLARGRHFAFTAGWVVAAVVTVVAIASPMMLLDRVVFALTVGPAAGLVVHVVAFALHRRRASLP